MAGWAKVGVAAAVSMAVCAITGAGEPPVGVVCHVKVLSDKIEDVSSMDAWRKSFIKEGMTDEQKGIEVWETVVKFRHQDGPPNEFLQGEDNVHDPIRTFNVYGYGMCCCASSNIEGLARYLGLQARGRIIRAHSVPEVFWDGSWHMLDASLLNYFPKADGKIASVDEITASIKEWYDKNPEYKNNQDKLVQFMRNGGWRKGPEVLSHCPFYDENGWWPAATHGWYSTMAEYDGSASGIYEYGYSQGYEVNVQLRPGERLTRNWFNKGLHVNMLGGEAPGCLNKKIGTEDLRYAPKHGDIAPGRVGNGALEYIAPLADASFRYSALTCENLDYKDKTKGGSSVYVKDAAKPGVLVIRMPSSYVYLSGALAFAAAVGNGGEIAVSLSDNNGLDWKDVTKVTASGEQTVDLKPLVYRRYEYRLKLTLKGAGTGLNSLKITHDIQNSQRALPALAQGANTITFSAGPQEGTISIEGSVNESSKGKQLQIADFHPQLNGVKPQLLRLEGGKGDFTVPVETPGEMDRLRFGGHYRARDEKDGWDMQVSFDGGKTFKTIDRCAGPTPGSCKYVTVSDIPPGTKSALVRMSGTQRNTTCMFIFRIDADYKQPYGGFRPVKVTYVWEEGGVEKRDVHVAAKPQESYKIDCKEKPLMKSLIVELAD